MTPDPTSLSRRRVLGQAWVAYWVLLFLLTHTGLGAIAPTSIPDADKLEHFGAYFLLTCLGGWYRLSGNVRSRGRTLLIWACIYAAYGAFDEWLQQYVGRKMDVRDWLADCSGVVAATVVLLWAGRRRASK